MTKYYHKKGNRIVKYALLNLIADIMKSNATASFTWLDEGYENDNQRIHFTYGGIRCILDGVGCPVTLDDGLPDGTIKLKYTMLHNEKTYESLFSLSDIHINTLEKIACEVYDTLRREDDDEYDQVRNDYVSNFLDTYLCR